MMLFLNLNYNNTGFIGKKGQNYNFPVKKWTFFMRIQDSRSKTTERLQEKVKSVPDPT